MTVNRESVKLICTLFRLHLTLHECSGSGLCISGQTGQFCLIPAQEPSQELSVLLHLSHSFCVIYMQHLVMLSVLQLAAEAWSCRLRLYRPILQPKAARGGIRLPSALPT